MRVETWGSRGIKAAATVFTWLKRDEDMESIPRYSRFFWTRPLSLSPDCARKKDWVAVKELSLRHHIMGI